MERCAFARVRAFLALLAVVAACVLGAAAFLPSQCLWLDEATQLTGLAMGPAGVGHWLLGDGPAGTGQFADRMPPLGYWVQCAWAQAFGMSEASLRWCGVACVALATALVYDAARRAFGTRAALAAGLLFGSAPAVVVMAVEIRPYPLFVLCAAGAFHALVRMFTGDADERSRPRVACTLALWLAAAMFTHFFGAVLAGATLLALTILNARGKCGWRQIAIVGAGVAIALALVAPYVLAAAGNSNPLATQSMSTSECLEGVKHLAVRLFTHVAISVSGPLSIVAVVAGGLLVLLAAAARPSTRLCARVLAIVIGAGLLAVTAGRFALNGFDASSPNYNIWMRPGLCIMLAAGLTAEQVWFRRAAIAACACLLGAQGYGLVVLARHGDHFAHGPHREIMSLLSTCLPGEVALVHDDPTHRFVFVACPLRWELKGELPQFVPAQNTSAPAAEVVRDNLCNSPAQRITSLPYRYVLVVRAAFTNPPNVAAQVRQGDRPIADGPLANALRASGDWQVVSEETSVSHISAKLDLFARRGPFDPKSPQLAHKDTQPLVPKKH